MGSMVCTIWYIYMEVRVKVLGITVFGTLLYLNSVYIHIRLSLSANANFAVSVQLMSTL